MEDADIVHVHYGNSSRLLSYLPRRVRKPIVLTFHDVLPRHRIVRMLAGSVPSRMWARKADAIVVHLEATRRLLSFDSQVIPMHAFASYEALPRFLPPPPLRVGLFGRQVRHKGLDWVREAFALLPKGDAIELVICGSNARRAALDFPWPRVRVVERPSGAAFDAELGRIHALVSIRFDFIGEASAVVPQALGMGVPILYNDGNLTQMALGGAGLSVASPGDLAAVLHELVSNRARLDAMRQAAFGLGRAWSLEVVADRYEGVYRRVLSSWRSLGGRGDSS